MQYKLLAVLTVVLLAFSSGWRTRSWYEDSKDKKEIIKQTDKAQQGQNKIIKFHQEVRKANVKDTCYNASMPDDIIKLLK